MDSNIMIAYQAARIEHELMAAHAARVAPHLGGRPARRLSLRALVARLTARGGGARPPILSSESEVAGAA